MNNQLAELCSPSSMVVFYRLFRLFSGVVYDAADIDFPSYTILAAVIARPTAMPATEVNSYFFERDMKENIRRQLADHELVEFVRNPRDRRSLALRVTTKGAARALAADRALGERILSTFPYVTEEGLNTFVGLAADHAALIERGSSHSLLFPAPLLRLLFLYWRKLSLVASRFNMISGQVALLALASQQDEDIEESTSIVNESDSYGFASLYEYDEGALARAAALGLDPSFIRLQEEFLADRGFLDAFTGALNPEGAQRLDDFSVRLAASLETLWSLRSADEHVRIMELAQCARYLFSAR